MGLFSCSGVVAVAVLSQSPAPPAPKVVLREVQVLVGKLTSRTERTVTLLTLAQAQNQTGDHTGALKSLRLGWSAHENGSDKGLNEGDATDLQTLLDEGDIATLPMEYAYQFVVAGDIAAARKSAMSMGNSALADSFRQGLGIKLRTQFPDKVDIVTLTDSQQEERTARKQQILAGIPAIREEQDIARRTFELYRAAQDLTRYSVSGEALPLLREAAGLSRQIDNPQWRVTNAAQISEELWYLNSKDEARQLLAEAEKYLPAVEDAAKRLDTQFSIEQAKRILGLPNDIEKVMAAQNARNGVLPRQTPPAPPVNLNEPYDLIGAAEQYRKKGDLAAAKRMLRRVKPGSGGDAWWLVLAAEMLIQLGEKVPARQNLAEGSRRLIASIRPTPYLNSEVTGKLEQIARAQIANGDKLAALRTLEDGFKKSAGAARFTKVLHMGDGGDHTVTHDQQSPVLHAGAIALARAGFYSNAIALARTIQSPSHRAAALAGAVRDGFPPGSYRRPN